MRSHAASITAVPASGGNNENRLAISATYRSYISLMLLLRD